MERARGFNLTMILALVAGFAGAALFAWSGLGGNGTREYLLAHPEVLHEAAGELERREMLARIEPYRNELERPFPGAVLGNPQGAVTLVEFSDYACGYCRASLEHVQQLVARHPDLKVVVREYPILSSQSADAARMALAAAEQGRYAAFHDAMFEAGPPSPEAIAAAAKQAGLDLERAREAIAAGRYEAQLRSNMILAQQLGVTGTPSWVVGDEMLTGAVGPERIGRAVEQARAS